MNLYALLADVILVLHLGIVLFIAGGFLLVWIGYFAGWRFIRNRRFRLLHLFAMGFVTLEALVGMACPLTDWEFRLRTLSGSVEASHQTFMQRLLQPILFYDLPESVFTIAYVIFLALMVVTWWRVRSIPAG
jgi:hypothetical protein